MPVGQAQKEFFVNEALARLDGLVQLCVEGQSNDPPANPVAGDCWIIGATPTGDWAEHAGKLAIHQSGNWLFQAPITGMQAFDKGTGHRLFFNGSWSDAVSVTTPSGGGTQDAEARAAISALIGALVTAGILA